MDFNDLKNLASSENIANIKEKVGDIAETVADKAREIGDKISQNETVKNIADKVKEGAEKVGNAVEHLPGVATNVADGNKVNPKLVKEDVKKLNNNPRNSD